MYRWVTAILAILALSGCDGAIPSADAGGADARPSDAAAADAGSLDGRSIDVDAGADGGTSDGGGSGGVSYSTDFDSDETVLSEGGHWQHSCSFFTTVSTSSGNAYGTSSSGSRGYVDSYAYLRGFPPDQRASGVIHKDGAGGYMEVELLLRWSDSSNSARGYEVFLHQGGAYLSIMRWSGAALTDVAEIDYFDEIGHVDNITAPRDGDVFTAQIVGNIITVTLAGATMLTADVSVLDGTTYADGNPGIGFDLGRSGAETADSNFGFRSYTATGL